MKLPLVASALAIILISFGGIILLPVIVACLEAEYWSTLPFIVASALAITLALILRLYGRENRDVDLLRRNEAMLIVALTWVVCGMIGAVPYLFFKLGPIDAL